MMQRGITSYEEKRDQMAYYENRMEDLNKTFAYYCSSWLSANCTCLKVSSLIKYERDIGKHIIPFFGSDHPCDITSEKVTAFTKMLLQERELSPKTVRNILALFHAIFLYAKKKKRASLSGAGYRLPEREQERGTGIG